MIKDRVFSKRSLALLIFTVIFLATRIPRISTDEINPDGVNWHYRMQQFVVGLKTLQLEKTYQHYHPGVTLMWSAGIPVELYKQITGVNVYDMNNFQNFHLVAKVSVVFIQLLLSILAIYLLSKIGNFKTAFLTILIMSLEPFFLGNSRLFHMDVLLTLFLFNSLLSAFLSLKSRDLKYAFLAGLLLSLTFLTKSIGITAFFYVVVYSILFLALNKDLKFAKKYFPVLLSSALISLFLFFPALIKGPFYYLGQIFSESERVGARNGHGQIVLGGYTEEAGINFYPLVLLMKLSPFTILGVLIYLTFALRKNIAGTSVGAFFTQNTTLYLFLYAAGYFVLMSLFSKKIDRYMIPLYPFFCYFAVLGYLSVIDILQKNQKEKIASSVIILLFCGFLVYPDIKTFPFQFTYTSPVFGSTENANRVIAQKPFGIGIFDLKNAIIARYGDKAKLGFLDVKPIEAIYPNSQVFDIRITGPGSYDYIVLGVNEVIPEKIQNDTRFIFEKDYSLRINGLEYWRVYVKKAK